MEKMIDVHGKEVELNIGIVIYNIKCVGDLRLVIHDIIQKKGEPNKYLLCDRKRIAVDRPYTLTELFNAGFIVLTMIDQKQIGKVIPSQTEVKEQKKDDEQEIKKMADEIIAVIRKYTERKNK